MVGTVRLPLDRIANVPEGVVIARMLVDGWDDVVAVRVTFRWDPVRTAVRRAAVARSRADGFPGCLIVRTTTRDAASRPTFTV